jgi:hypothetical protein
MFHSEEKLFAAHGKDIGAGAKGSVGVWAKENEPAQAADDAKKR